MSVDRRQVARAGAFVGDTPFGPDAERERGIVVEEERRDVIVVDAAMPPMIRAIWSFLFAVARGF
jgi:hypothetical protein